MGLQRLMRTPGARGALSEPQGLQVRDRMHPEKCCARFVHAFSLACSFALSRLQEKRGETHALSCVGRRRRRTSDIAKGAKLRKYTLFYPRRRFLDFQGKWASLAVP